MNTIIDKEDLLFFQKRINALELDKVYTNRIHLMINKSLANYDILIGSYKIQHALFHTIWLEISKLCEMLFKREDEFFNTLRAMECEFAGRTFIARVQLGWVNQSSDSPEFVDDFLMLDIR